MLQFIEIIFLVPALLLLKLHVLKYENDDNDDCNNNNTFILQYNFARVSVYLL